MDEAMSAHHAISILTRFGRLWPAGATSTRRKDPGRMRADLRGGVARAAGFTLGEALRHVMDENYCPVRLPGGGTSRLFAEAMARVGYILYPTRALPPFDRA